MNKQKIILSMMAILVLVLPGAVHAQDSDDQFTVGLLLYDTTPFIEEMTSLGYIEGENISYMTYEMENFTPEQFADMDFMMQYVTERIQVMVDAQVDVFVTNNDSEALNLQLQAGDIPIVFIISDDPVATGVVTDLTTPGGSVTGIVSNRHHERRLQLLTEVDPDIRTVYYLYSTYALEGEAIFNAVRNLGEELGVDVIGAPVTDSQSGIQILSEAPDDVDWFFMTPYVPFDVEFSNALIEASNTHDAAIAGYWAAPMPGYLINYGPDLVVVARQSAHLVDRILRGANPGDLPVVIAENGLVVNLEEAELRGMEVPVAVLRQADVIVRPGDLDQFAVPGA